jgi:ABC-type branched-subunit amino acid transport system ATPase component
VEPLLVASALRKTYGAVTALQRLDLTVRGGEVVGLVGPIRALGPELMW